VPVISTRISGLPELIAHGHEGLLVEPRSPEALVVAITNLLSSNELRTSFSKNARIKVINEFDVEVNINRFIKLINN